MSKKVPNPKGRKQIATGDSTSKASTTPRSSVASLSGDPKSRRWWVSAIVCIGIGIIVFVYAQVNPDHVIFSNARSIALPEFESSLFNPRAPESVQIATPPGMVWIPGGEFSMGCSESSESLCGYPGLTNDTMPIHRVYVDGFWMDETEVTNAQFREFVDATGYITVAERTPTPEDLPEVPLDKLVAGSTVFTQTPFRVPLGNYLAWWRYEPGACWYAPEGPGSNIDGKDDYPVIHIAYEDAVAYCNWAGKRLPTEAEWEFAARGGLAGALYPWGNELRPDGKFMANTFQGPFPMKDTGEDGFAGLAPVKSYPPNAYGLYDMSGNVWEWCSDWYRHDFYSIQAARGKLAVNPQGPNSSYDPDEPGAKKKVHRGGSFLCSDDYCSRYIVGTRGKGEIGTASNHCGFRCVRTFTPTERTDDN